jgi:DivIVA domain-containing protein
MASMDVTPQELRDIEIREAWRGYHRDDVDELLERAAATIEHLDAEVQQLRSRSAQAPPPAPAPAPAPAPVVAPAPAPAPAPVPVAPAAPAVRSADTDVIQRTLVLAQKAADEAVADARAKAQQMVTDAEQRSQRLVADAEASAARVAERERSRLEEEIDRLQRARDTLNSDVDALERFEGEYRDRLRRAIESELDLLSKTTGGSDRPALHDVDIPAVSAPAVTSVPSVPSASWSAGSSDESWSASGEGVMATPVAVPPPPPPAQQTVHIEAVPAASADWDPAPAGGWGDTPTAAVVDDSGEYPVDAQEHGDSLDDDAFFASLREAVRDDAPLGQDDAAHYADDEDTEEHRRLFKRRR